MKPNPLIVANWKMHHCYKDAALFVEDLKNNDFFSSTQKTNIGLAIAPPFVLLAYLADLFEKNQITEVSLAAQNMHWQDEGAFTGEVSPELLKDTGVNYVILGHSERREHFLESNTFIAKKFASALKKSLIPILCVGETLAERQKNQAFAKIKTQIQTALVSDQIKNKPFVIAYEPIWAIGTGQTAKPEQIFEIHQQIKHFVAQEFNVESFPLLYGGSVKPSNACELAQIEGVDGFLVGSASLKAESFLAIAKSKQTE